MIISRKRHTFPHDIRQHGTFAMRTKSPLPSLSHQKNHGKQKRRNPDTALRSDSACRGLIFCFWALKIRTSEVGTLPQAPSRGCIHGAGMRALFRYVCSASGRCLFAWPQYNRILFWCQAICEYIFENHADMMRRSTTKRGKLKADGWFLLQSGI